MIRGFDVPLFLFCVFGLVSSVSAYVDPGSGSYLLQIALGILFAGIYAARHYWKRLMNLLKLRRGDKRNRD